MRIREIECFIDCSMIIMYGSEDEFIQWLNENEFDDVTTKDKPGLGGPIVSNGLYVHCLWVRKSDDISSVNAIATLASYASRLADNIDKYVCSTSNTNHREMMPPELRARVIEKVVRVGTEMILEKGAAA